GFMITTRRFKSRATAIAALSLTGLLALSACEERPYPTAAKTYNEPAYAPPPAQLAGAPATPPAYAPPPAAYAPPAPAYSPPARAYDPPAIVAMAPIPNPGQPGSDGYYNGYRHHGRYAVAPAYGEAPRPRAPHPVAPPTYAAKPAPAYPAKPAPTYAPKPVPPVKTYAAQPPVPPKPTPPAYTPPKKPDTYAQKGAAVGAAAGAAAGVVAKVAKPDA
ncbi:hypothetical protein ACNJUT_21115, partial [Mycobacterium tuberculosis]